MRSTPSFEPDLFKRALGAEFGWKAARNRKLKFTFEFPNIRLNISPSQFDLAKPCAEEARLGPLWTVDARLEPCRVRRRQRRAEGDLYLAALWGLIKITFL